MVIGSSQLNERYFNYCLPRNSLSPVRYATRSLPNKAENFSITSIRLVVWKFPFFSKISQIIGITKL